MLNSSKYNPEGKIIRSAQEIKHGLLSHPDNADRRDELELLIDWRLAQESHFNRHGKAMIKAFDQRMDGEKSASLRALSLLHQLEGEDTTYHTAKSSLTQSIRDILLQPLERQIRIDSERLESLRQFPIVSFLPVKNSIRLDGLSAAFAQKAEGEEDRAMDFVERHFVSSQPKPPTPRMS